jgi:hypothetical protein
MIAAPATLVDAAPESSGLPSPRLLYSLDVNALNFCRFSLLPVKSPARIDGDHEAYLAVPNLVDSSVVRFAQSSKLCGNMFMITY